MLGRFRESVRFLHLHAPIVYRLGIYPAETNSILIRNGFKPGQGEQTVRDCGFCLGRWTDAARQRFKRFLSGLRPEFLVQIDQFLRRWDWVDAVSRVSLKFVSHSMRLHIKNFKIITEAWMQIIQFVCSGEIDGQLEKFRVFIRTLAILLAFLRPARREALLQVVLVFREPQRGGFDEREVLFATRLREG